MIAKPLECLAHAPELTKLRENKLESLANPSIWVKRNVTRAVKNVPDWKPLE